MAYDHIESVGCGVDMWSELETTVSSSKHISKIWRKIFKNELAQGFSYKS